MSVAGFDDVHLSRFSAPSLTTVRQPMHEIGAAAVEMLRWRLQRASVDARPRRMLLTPEFVERATHGPCNEAGLLEALRAIGI
jgi:LacI family transcriptional regulator